jgi:REP element-mobilizing transposase RayT
MSEPRYLIKGSTSLITRRCTERKFFLRPDKKVNKIILYCLGYGSCRYNVDIHAFCFLSNHYHLITTDPYCNMPFFMTWVNAFIAKHLNMILERKGHFWAPGSYSMAKIGHPDYHVSPEDVKDKLVYVYTNPVSAGLVKHYKDWPGVISTPKQMGGEPIEIERPNIFFDENGSMPEKVKFQLKIPDCFKNLKRKEVIRLLNEEIHKEEDKIQKEFREKGKTFLGREKVLIQSPFKTPKTPEKKKQINPRLICKDKWYRIFILALINTFFEKYKKALKKVKEGDKNVVFPYGTYKMRVFFRFECEENPFLAFKDTS